jgi:hypothetical protein
VIPRPGLHAAAWLATHPPLTPLMACKNRLVRQLERMGQKVIFEPVGPRWLPVGDEQRADILAY